MLAVNPALTAAQIVAGPARHRAAACHLACPAWPRARDANPGRCLCTTATCGAGILDVPQALAYAPPTLRAGAAR